ncbi:MAG: choice-of-anchor Q domain-containing protein [Caldilineaceae bacterium]
MKSLTTRFIPSFLVALWGLFFFPLLAQAANFTVNSTADTVDTAPGNGVCADADGKCSLRAAILEANALNGDDTITLAATTYTLSLAGAGEDTGQSGDLDVTAGGLTLIGAGSSGAITSILDGAGLDRVLDLHSDSNVSLRRIAITGGADPDPLGSDFDMGQGGGGIRAWEAALTLNQVLIEGNSSKTYGGGISFSVNAFGRPQPVTLSAHNVTLHDNRATLNGGGMMIGGAATLQMSDSNVISNTALSTSTSGIIRYGGGGLYIAQGYTPLGGDLLNTTVYLTKTTFTDNLATDRHNGLISGAAWGGAIHMEFAVVHIEDSAFTHNIADGDNGGAIYDDGGTFTVSNSTFDNNISLAEGGAIATGSVLFSSIDSSHFTNNRAIDSILGGGGAVSGSGQPSGGFFGISNSTFENNSTAGSGGALRIGSNSTVHNSSFISNSAESNGGAIVVTQSSMDAPAIIDHVTLDRNQAGVRGGGIQNNDVLYLSDSIIRNNSTVLGQGGGISNYQAYALIITNTDILSNVAANLGGALFDSHLTQGSNNIFPLTTQLTDVYINGNQSQTDCGGICSLATMKIVNSTISSNHAITSGGGILAYSNFQFSSEREAYPINLEMINVTLSDNSAGEGGAIYQNNGVTELNNVTIAGNSASNNRGGGGIYTDKDFVGDAINPNTITLANTILAQNSASTGPDCANDVLSGGNNLLGDNSNCTFSSAAGDQLGTGATPIDPKLAALANNGGATPTRALQSGSPAINKGNAATCAAADQRGAARVNTCDVGAFEFGSAPKQDQTITFVKPANKTMGDAPFTLSATASSGLAVSFASQTLAVCTISGSTVTLVAAGTCTIRATQAGNGSFNAAPPVTQSFTVASKPVDPTKKLFLPLLQR